MKEPKTYTTATAFRRALEARLQEIAKSEGVDLQRLRRQVAFDRFLARLFREGQQRTLPWILKGGYAMELRIKSARTTKDIDLTLRGAGLGRTSGNQENRVLLESLQEASAVDIGDFFVYRVGEPISDLEAAPYGGARFPIEGRVDGRKFVGFHLDIGIGDVVMEPLEAIEGRNWLQFAGIASPSLYMIPREQQFAEKLHAYTLPRRGGVNSRVRDLVDMVLLIQSGTMANEKLAEAIRITFERRKTHALPKALAQPPTDWQTPYSALAKECGVSGSVNDAFASLGTYLGERGIPEMKPSKR